MIISVEVSLYPLQKNYRSAVKDFIERIAQNTKLNINYSAMSTTLVGEFQEIMPILNNEIFNTLTDIPESVFVIKLSGGCH